MLRAAEAPGQDQCIVAPPPPSTPWCSIGRYPFASCSWSRRRSGATSTSGALRGGALVVRLDGGGGGQVGRLGGEHRGADDAGAVQQRRGHAAHAGREVLDEVRCVLADAAADDHEVGPEQRVDGVEVLREELPPLVPAEALALLD